MFRFSALKKSFRALGISDQGDNAFSYKPTIVAPIGSEGMSLFFSSTADDHNTHMGDIGFDFPFYNSTYRNNIYVGSNSYITFGFGSNLYYGFTYNNPGRGLLIKAEDNSYQQVFGRSDKLGKSFRIRFEGTNSVGGIVGSPNIVWEATLFDDGTIQLATGVFVPRHSNSVCLITDGNATTYINYTFPNNNPANTSLVFLRQSSTQYIVLTGSYS